MSGWLPVLIALAVGIGATAWTVSAWRWKADSGDHRLARWYHHSERFQSWPFNNGAAIAPIVAAWGFLFAGALSVGELDSRLADELAWLAALIGLPLFILTAWALIRPPSWMQPAWLAEARCRQKAGLPSNVPVPPEGDRPVMSRRAFGLTIAGLVLFAAAWLYFELPVQHLLLGFAAGVPVLIATRIKK